MIGNSLRLRLLAGAAGAILVALVIAWIVMIFLFQRHIETRVEQELQRYGLQLVAGFEVNADGSIAFQQSPADPRFETPASGLYWQITGDGGTWRSRSLWDQILPPSPSANAAEWQSRIFEGPFDERLFVLERLIQPGDDASPLFVQVALNEAEIITARDEFGRSLAIFLFVLWIVLAGAAWIQVHLGLHPLGKLRKELAALRFNAAERLAGNYPSEVVPLTRAINDLANAREADLRRARQRAADLAHGMKTPLAALSAQSRIIRQNGSNAGSMADGLDKAIAAAGAAVEAELARSRAAANRHSGGDLRVSPSAVVKRLISVLEHTEKGMRLDYELELPDQMHIPVAEDDLTEILGPLLENAARYARRMVRVAGEATNGAVHLSVEDDGPGIDPGDAAEVMARGKRLDQIGSGHGLGLAIARELIEATGGTIALSKSSLGGLSADICWNTRAVE